MSRFLNFIARSTLGTALALSFSLSGTLTHAEDPGLIAFDWSGFQLPDLLATYVAKNGDMPTFSIFADDDEAFQKLSSGFKADVAHPCSQMVQKYRDAGLIEPWDTSKIPNFKEIDPLYLSSSVIKDAGGVWYIPTDFAFTAIAYNTKEVPSEDVASLDVFTNPKYAGRISLPDNADDVWALALLATGVHDWTKVNDDQFKAAAAWLRKVHPNVLAYWADPAQLSQLIASGEVVVAWSWNDTVALLHAQKFPVGFQRRAKEGASSFLCGWVNLKNGPGKEDKAYDFINAWLDHDAAKALLANIGYSSTNTVSMAAIDPAELKAADVDPVETTLLPQSPLDQVLRDRMLKEFEAIKSGF